MSKEDLLFSPLSLGPITLANRLVRAATLECMFSTPGVIDAAYTTVYENLARGGVGLIVTGNYFVHPAGVVQGNNLLVDCDTVIETLAGFTRAVKIHGVPLFAQLNHGGRYAQKSLTGMQPMAPSAVKDTVYRVLPRAMTEVDIETAIASFVSAARRMKDAGFDGVEINASHGYLINQFLSGATNRRRDGWGGSLANRFRFLEQVVVRTRAVVGADFPLLVKMNCDDYMRRGTTVEEAAQFARLLESRGVSGLAITGGFKEKAFRSMSRGDIPRQLVLKGRKGMNLILSRMYLAMMKRASRFEEGYFLDKAARIRRQVTIPVITIGGFRSFTFMEQAIQHGLTDLIGLSRPLIREPSLPRKLKGGAAAAATCVNCNRCTIMTGLRSEPLRCHWRKDAEAEEGGPGERTSAQKLITSDGFPLFYRSTFPAHPRGAVIFLHGMSEHSGMYLHVISALHDARFAVIAPDQRGRGRSVNDRWRRGDLHSIPRVLEDLDELRASNRAALAGLPLFLVALSMGSIIAENYAIARQGSLAGLVIVGPPFGLPKNASRMLVALSALAAIAAPRLALREAPPIPQISRVRTFQSELEWDPYCYHGPLRACAARQLARALIEAEKRIDELTLPLHIVYGTEDKIVSLDEVREIQGRWGGSDLTVSLWPGLYHDVLNEPERQEAIAGIVSWLLARSPSS